MNSLPRRRYSPVQAFVVVAAVEKLYFFERLLARSVRRNVWMHRQERVQRRGAGLLRSDDQKLGKAQARFFIRPDLEMSLVRARVLHNTRTDEKNKRPKSKTKNGAATHAPHRIGFLGIQLEVFLGQL